MNILFSIFSTEAKLSRSALATFWSWPLRETINLNLALPSEISLKKLFLRVYVVSFAAFVTLGYPKVDELALMQNPSIVVNGAVSSWNRACSEDGLELM